jgi:hypothetical protein
MNFQELMTRLAELDKPVQEQQTVDQAKSDPRYTSDPEFKKEVDKASDFEKSLSGQGGRATPKIITKYNKDGQEYDSTTGRLRATFPNKPGEPMSIEPVKEADDDKADKDYDGDGDVESPKDEVWGSRAKAAAQSGKPFKEDSMEETFEQGIEEIADEVEECGDMMGPMGSMPPKQSDNVSMNITMNGSGSGGIRDLMNILRDIEDGPDKGHDHDMDGPMGMLIKKKEPMLGDEFANSPDEMQAPMSSMIASGDDLHKAKNSFSDKPFRGDNPMALEGLKERLESLYEEIKSK